MWKTKKRRLTSSLRIQKNIRFLAPFDAVRQASFTLVEVILAVGIMATFLVQIASVQGNSVYFAEYGRNVMKGTWLAKQLMSQVDYHYHVKPFEALKGVDVTKGEFEGVEDFTYDLVIEDFPLPISSIVANSLTGGGSQDDDDPIKDVSKDGLTDQVDSTVREFLGDEVMKLARVTVYWPEGAKRNSVTLSYLIANLKKISEVLSQVGAMSGTPASTGSPNTPNTGSRPSGRGTGGGN